MRQAFFAALAAAMLLSAATSLAQEVVADGLNNPMGLMVAPDGSVWVIDSGVGGDQEIEAVDPMSGEPLTATFGATSQVVRIAPDGTQELRASLPSVNLGQEFLGGARLARLGTQVYATSGGWLSDFGPEPLPMMSAVVRVDAGEPRLVADTWALEAESNPDGFILESHPYGLLGGADGKLYVADAGANTLLRVNPRTGATEVLAVFEGIPSPMPNPNRGGAEESDPVPTGITQGRDGTIYVSLLPGFPFLPGSSQVVSVSSRGEVATVAEGLTMVTDLQAAPNGSLYAVTLGEFTEQGPVPGSGAVSRVSLDGTVEPALEGLSFPTAIAFAPNGDAYLTLNGVGAPGSGQVVRYAGLGAP